jgi:hypothetical protein
MQQSRNCPKKLISIFEDIKGLTGVRESLLKVQMTCSQQIVLPTFQNRPLYELGQPVLPMWKKDYVIACSTYFGSNCAY